MKKETVIMILESLDANYRQRMSEKEMALNVRNWEAVLSDITDKQGMEGLRKALENPGEFMPPVGKFKQMCIAGDGAENLEDEALKAWGVVIGNLNAYASPVFRDTAIAETIRKMGGWKKLCSMLEEETAFRKRDFVELYPIYRRQKDVYNPMLKGKDSFFSGGKLVNDYKFIGFSSENGKRKALELAKAFEIAESRVAALIGG